MKGFVTHFLREEDGVTALEYGLIAGLIALAIVTAATNVGGALNGMFAAISAKLNSASGN
jgi:pilus assembly protein Flp/PilA